MQVDRQELHRHYASLSDEELLDLDRADLTELAQKYYDEEMGKRALTSASEAAANSPPAARAAALEVEAEVDSDWLEDAACACSFSGRHESTAADDAASALAALQAAGIPCQVSVQDPDPSNADAQYPEYRVMVPGPLTLLATSVLDKELFNANLEAEWKAHFAELSDEELEAVNAEFICAGLLDRVARLRRAYQEEVKRRK